MREAEANYPGAGWEIYQLWRDCNEQFFGRQMEHCPIQFTPVSGERFGLWQGEERSIILSTELLHRDGKVWHLHHEELGYNFPPDALLRQMAIQYISTVRGVGLTDQAGIPIEPLSENDWWLRETNRLSGEMDVEQPGSPHEARWWPYSARPEGYYDAYWIAVRTRDKGRGPE